MATIFAPATAPGKSGVAILRVSGPKALQALEYFAITPPAPRHTHYCRLVSPETQEIIDHGLVIYFPSPHSFTGEDVVELHLHGSRAVMKETLAQLTKIPGLRLAEPGEFTRQAFYNNKMDLAQAEGLADLIDAETALQKKMALRQMGGEVSQAAETLRQAIIGVRAHLEAYLDFPDEDIPPSVAEGLNQEITEIAETIRHRLTQSRYGETLRQGFYGVILGIPNAGKSTLLNALAKREIAIVSDIAGTTRDVLEAQLDIEGYPLTLADTAGIREQAEQIEAVGIERALQRAESSDFRLIVLDATQASADQQAILSRILPDDLIILNKIDGQPQDIVENIQNNHLIEISAKEGIGFDTLISALKERMEALYDVSSDLVITQTRHRHAYENALDALENAGQIDAVELKGEELRIASHALSSIIGLVALDDILDHVFSRFCIGK